MGTTVNQFVREYLERLSGSARQEELANEFRGLAHLSTARSNGWKFHREELHAIPQAPYTESDSPRSTVMTVTVKGFKNGQEIEFRASGGVITIAPKLPNADDEYTPEQRRIVTAQLAGGLADIKAGRVRGPFATHKEFIASLREETKTSRRKTISRPA